MFDIEGQNLREATERRDLLEIMLKDLLGAVEHFYGSDGLGKVVGQMKRMNKAREDNKEIDALEEMMSTWR